MGSRFVFNEVVLQATSLCNLNCSYCYVPNRDKDQRMTPAVTEALVRSLENLPKHEHPIWLLWHCGEPMAAGVKHMRALFEPFEELRKKKQVAHRFQTNATLIDKAWCDFLVDYNVEIAVSLDGPPKMNKHRLYWNGKESFDKAIRGIERLREIGCGDPCVIAVITEDRLGDAQEIYDFFVKIGCSGLGINIEESHGANLVRPKVRAERVEKFWRDLYRANKANPKFEIREIGLFEDWYAITKGESPPLEEQPTYRSNYFPTIGHNGDVVFLSTELIDCDAGKYGTFVVGNILDESLDDLVRKMKKTEYVKDFLAGVDACKATCPYYSFCGGGYATNKFFELGTMNGTQTSACTNVRQRLFDALIKEKRREEQEALLKAG